MSELKQKGLRIYYFLLHCFQSSLCYGLVFKESPPGDKKWGFTSKCSIYEESVCLLRILSSTKRLVSFYGNVAKMITATAGQELRKLSSELNLSLCEIIFRCRLGNATHFMNHCGAASIF